MARRAAVSGQFYPGDKRRLNAELNDMIPESNEKIDVIGAVVPHAGYMYSGHVAGEVYSKIRPKSTYIIMSPNHTGYGEDFALSAEEWETPLGKVGVDAELIDKMMAKTDLLAIDESAHAHEHSVEVHIPFIQKTAPKAKIVPLTIKLNSMAHFKEIGNAVSSAIKETGRDAVIIASSDMSHYLPREIAREKDNIAIQKVLEMDPEGLLEVVHKEEISMCGFMPTTTMLICAKNLGAKNAELVRYTDSGDVSGDTLLVVGYAGIIVY